MMTATRRTVAIGLALLVGACMSTGHDFVRPDVSSLVLGQTTVADAIAKIGPPTTRNSSHSLNPVQGNPALEARPGVKVTSIPGTNETLVYSYIHTAVPGVIVGPVVGGSRSLSLSFWNDHLVAYSFESSFETDSTRFDESAANAFVEGKTTRSEVLNQLGRPTGEAIYPYGLLKEGMRSVTYRSVIRETKGWMPSATETTIHNKTLRLVFDASDKLVERRLNTFVTGN
jgi:hypothetical protein